MSDLASCFKSVILKESKVNAVWVISSCLLAFGMGAYLSQWTGTRLSSIVASMSILVAILLDFSIMAVTVSSKRRELA